MKTKDDSRNSLRHDESGAALVAVLLVAVLLGIACVALLSAASAASREGTDLLNETKAYYAAESGIQASVNALRYSDAGGPVNYKDAVNGFANSGDLSAFGLTYADCNGDQRVRVAGDCNNSFKILVRDPDDSQSSLTIGTTGAQFRFLDSAGVVISNWVAPTRSFSNGTVLTWTPNPNNPTNLSFSVGSPTANALIGTFTLANGTVMDAATDFKVFYYLGIPGNPGWLISGRVAANGAVTVLSSKYLISGSEITICGNSQNCGALVAGSTTLNINGVIKPKEPSRLQITASGFGPNGSRKVLEAVVQKSPLDGANSSSPFSMNGPCAETGNPSNTAVFQAGTSNVTTYSGVSSGGVIAPAFGFNAQCNLDTANAWIAAHLTPNGQNQTAQVSPPPAYFETYQLPEWQRTPLELDAKVQVYRAQAQYSGTYYNPAPSKITNPGYVSGQTGQITTVTFCEGNCTVDGALGGGILVVTGKLTSLGGFGFKGLILVTGAGGWERAGGGCGEIIGNVVIAPYNSSNLVSNVFTLPPKYEITGAGCSGVIYASLDDLFVGENATTTNLIQGVAEK